MDALSHQFALSKEIMLNVLYDTLERIGFTLEKANSERGTLIVFSSNQAGRRMRIACEGSYTEQHSIVRIFPDIMDAIGQQTAKLLMEEIIATIHSSTKKPTLFEGRM
jgi:hypothetical protein